MCGSAPAPGESVAWGRTGSQAACGTPGAAHPIAAKAPIAGPFVIIGLRCVGAGLPPLGVSSES